LSAIGGFQFAHLESYSRKGDKKGRSVSFVLAEARRDFGASIHVGKPQPPVVIHGVCIDELERLHDEQAANSVTVPKGGKARRIRQDQHTLMTVVVSHPYTPDEVRADPDKLIDVMEWERRNLAWLKAMYGDGLVSVVRHEDESRWHLHAFVLPTSQDMRATALHPGHQAKAQVMASGPKAGEDSKALNRRGDAAYKAAMRDWQDQYFQAVAAPCGLARLGPGKRRLTRAEWQREKTQATALQESIKRAKTVQARVAGVVQEAQQAALVAKQKAAESESLHNRNVQSARKAAKAATKARGELNAIQASTRRLQGLGGHFRAALDGLQSSRVARTIAAKFRHQIEALHAALQLAQQNLADERQRRRELQQKLTATSASLHEIAAARDHAMKDLAKLQERLESRLQLADYRYDKKGLKP
jgi:hypothetical protein